MNSNLLRLEDCLEDSPQTRALIGVYEADAEKLLEYSRSISKVCHRVAEAQNELAQATQLLTHQLRGFQATNSLLTSEDDAMSVTAQQLANSIDEVASFNTVLYTELSENMEYHCSRFLDKDLSEYLRLKGNFQASDKAHEEAAAKLARVSKKKQSEKSWQEATDQLYAARKSFHNTSMLYCTCLNDLQSKKKIGILQPVVSYLQSQVRFFQMGSDINKVELDDMLKKLTNDLTEIDRINNENRDLCVEKMDRLDAQSTRAYIPDPPASMDFPDLPVDKAKTQIRGYLFCRSRGGILTHWNRSYFFTQGGNLMQQSKNEFAGQFFMDLDGCAVSRADVDDRRNVFQVVSSDRRHTAVLQGESKQQCDEWISTIQNIAAGLYLVDDPRQAIIDAQKSPETSNTSASKQSSETPLGQPDQSEERKSRGVSTSSSVGADRRSRSSSFENKHEAYRPSMFERLKQAATSLITPEERPAKEEPVAAASEVEKSMGGGDTGHVDADAPVLFDLPSPTSEEIQVKLQDTGGNVTDNNPTNASAEVAIEDSTKPTRQNPFSSEDDVAVANGDSAFKAIFVVRFLGCKQINPERDLDHSIIDTICQVMTARALHKVFRMTELHIVISDRSVSLVDSGSQLSREVFPISRIVRTKTHSDNPRLLGFIAQHPSSNQFLCYTFESNADGDDVCCAINTARVLEESKIEHDEITKQRKIEDDLEKQSKLITASSCSGLQTDAVEQDPSDELA